MHPEGQQRTWYQILSCFCASPFSGYHGSFPKGYYPGFYQKRRHNLVFDTSQKSCGCLVSHTRLQLEPQTSMHTCIAELCLGTFLCKTPKATLATHIATHATHTEILFSLSLIDTNGNGDVALVGRHPLHTTYYVGAPRQSVRRQ